MYDAWYAEQSRAAHQKDLAVAWAIDAEDRPAHFLDEAHVERALTPATLLFLCIVTELGHEGCWLPERCVSEAWTAVQSIDATAPLVFATRYEALAAQAPSTSS